MPQYSDLLDNLERPFLDAVRNAIARRGLRQQDVANSMAAYGLVIHDTGISKSIATKGPRRALRLAEVLAIASILGIGLDDFIPPPIECPTCSGRPPQGFTCNQCGTARHT